jgi:hypothetical protein
MITLFSRLYMRVGVLHTRGKHLHDRIVSLRGDVWALKTSLKRHFLLKCLHQTKKRSGRASMC